MKRFALAVFLVLLCSLCIVLQQVRPVKAWSGTVHILADGSIYPADAPVQRDGEVYTLTGNVVGNTQGIVVERNNVVIDGSGFAVEAPDPWSGIYLYGRINVTIQNTNVRNCRSGIMLNGFSNSSRISGNRITDCWAYGIYIFPSFDNIISGNNITDNAAGIMLKDSANNTVFHNNFINNSVQVSELTTEANSWDNGNEGNYWSSYNGYDANQDGIGDTPYAIGTNNVDRYPLMTLYIIPEFPSLLIPALSMIAILLTVLAFRRKHGLKQARARLS